MITHWRSASAKPRLACTEGSATLMIVASSAIISWASARNTNAAQRVAQPVGPASVPAGQCITGSSDQAGQIGGVRQKIEIK